MSHQIPHIILRIIYFSPFVCAGPDRETYVENTKKQIKIGRAMDEREREREREREKQSELETEREPRTSHD